MNSSNFKVSKSYQKTTALGFTLVELLIVIALIGSLAGVLMNILNQQRQRDYAEDSVRRLHLDQTSKAIETYYTSERSYPDQGGASHNPKLGSDSAVVDFYLEIWPVGLVYNENGANFSIHIRKATTTDYFKYCSVWHEIRECADGTDVNNVTDCD
jgi:prepilin-type N-terminal cleavage/methylation domain-containing protein